jgi:hypothetical protein
MAMGVTVVVMGVVVGMGVRHGKTLYYNITGVYAPDLGLYTLLLPGLAQAYWLWELWPSKGIPSHPLAVMCAAWLALLGIWIVAKTTLFGRRSLQLN